MAYCDVCGNFDDSYNNESSFNQEWKDARKEFDENYRPELLTCPEPWPEL